MARVTILFMAITLFASASLAGAAAAPQYTCSLVKAFECTPDDGCQEWSLMEMTLPRFVRVDLTAKKITSLDKQFPRDPTAIDSVQQIEGMVVLHGTEQRSWTIAIAEDSGNLALTAAGDGGVFTVFGSCMTP